MHACSRQKKTDVRLQALRYITHISLAFLERAELRHLLLLVRSLRAVLRGHDSGDDVPAHRR